jgi:hypothetical protein
MDGKGLVVPEGRRFEGRRLGSVDLFEGFPVYFQGALVPRAAFLATGPFNPSFRVQPDIEYGYRLFSRCRAEFVNRSVFRYGWHTTNNSRDRIGTREEIVRILENLEGVDGEAVAAIGRKRLRNRVARHLYRVARVRSRMGYPAEAMAVLNRALAVRPLQPRYRALQALLALRSWQMK